MFLFIAGISPGKPQRWRTLKPEYCPHCHNTERWILEKVKHNLTFFFIPLIPVRTDYLYYCPICGYQKPVDKETFEYKIKFEAELIDN